MSSELQNSNFLNRLHSLQRLCSNSDEKFPSGLLFIAGPDGRYNKGSLNVIKYLFQGATGKYLLEGSLDELYEPLEELVLLVQQTSVSVIWRYHGSISIHNIRLQYYSNMHLKFLLSVMHQKRWLVLFYPKFPYSSNIYLLSKRKKWYVEFCFSIYISWNLVCIFVMHHFPIVVII